MHRYCRAFLLLPLAATAGGCTVHAFTPPARAMPLVSSDAPGAGHDDVQLDANATGEPVGPAMQSGNLGVRRGITDGVALTADASLVRVVGDESDENPHGAMGRIGVQRHGNANEDLTVSAFGGVGGGYAPAAGSWVTADVGASYTGRHRYVRPMFVVDAYMSQPFATERFMVGTEELRLPRTTGVLGLFGFEIGPRRSCAIIGATVARLWASSNDTEAAHAATFIGLGGGARFADF